MFFLVRYMGFYLAYCTQLLISLQHNAMNAIIFINTEKHLVHMTLPWTTRYLPSSTKEVVGQQKAIEQLLHFINEYRRNTGKCAILYGSIGCGKTSAAIAAAQELNLELLEMNASDLRNKDSLQQIIGSAIQQQSLLYRGKVILLDELDALSGSKDRGGIQALAKLVQDAPFPIICTLQDPFDQKLKALRKQAILIEFTTLDYHSITKRLIHILKAEECAFEEDALRSIARRSGGDMRAAITDTQMITDSGKKKLSKEALGELTDHERHRTEKLTNALMRVLKTTDIEVARTAFDDVEEDVDTIALWLEENVPKEYEHDDLARAFLVLSRADVFKGRIRRWQYWRFLSYMFALYSAGIACAKEEKYKKFVQYGPPSRLLKLWQAKMKYQKKKTIAEKLAPGCHMSTKAFSQQVLPFLQVMSRNTKMREHIAQEYELEKEEISWLHHA